jgi:hypothetical protein
VAESPTSIWYSVTSPRAFQGVQRTSRRIASIWGMKADGGLLGA